ncbi:transposase, partial [Rhodovulum sulfidophilum]|uniref:transposase n=1 Tax=Rhodovulum sulfidophilum TaxID=35806 RepID=UPI001F15FB38
PRIVSGSPLLREHDGTKRCLWRKIHIGADEQTLEIRAIAITGSNAGDAPMLPELLDRIPADVEIGTVPTDEVCNTHKFHDAVADRGADAVTRHLGRECRRWTGDHSRSRAEARMNCLKALGERLMSRGPDRQTAEIQIRIIRNCRSDQWRDMAHS